jgi:hypothetical protein
MLARLDYRAPAPGAAVPFTQGQAGALEEAQRLLAEGRAEAAAATLAAVTSR